MMKNREYEVVEDHPHLIRDTYSKGPITNRDVDAYEYVYVCGTKRKERHTQLDKLKEEEINSIKQEMSEMKEMLRQLLEKIVDLKELLEQQIP